MKKQLITLGLAVLSVPAFASKARLESLGQSADGSQYIDDHRSIFLNAAALNTHKNFATIEVGSAALAKGVEDETATPRAEGGVFKSSGNMVYGIYFGDESDSGNVAREALGGNDADMERNSMNLYVASNSGLNWGASFQMQSFKDETGASDVESSAMRGQFGVVSGDWDAFLNFGLGSEFDNGTTEFKGTSSIDLGLTYDMSGSSIFVRSRTGGAEGTTGGSKSKLESSALDLGFAKEYKLNDKANLWASVIYKTSEKTLGGTTIEKTTNLPVTFSLEGSATDWLTLRGFISHNIFIGESENSNGKKSTVDGLAHGIGASFVYGNLTIDGSLILSSLNGGTVDGTLNIDEPMNRVSLTYNF